MTIDSHGYDWIVKWGRDLGSPDEYIQQECDRAKEDGAPPDAVYRDHFGKWRTVKSITNPNTRERLGLD